MHFIIAMRGARRLFIVFVFLYQYILSQKKERSVYNGKLLSFVVRVGIRSL